jgi:hypothetical protein
MARLLPIPVSPVLLAGHVSVFLIDRRTLTLFTRHRQQCGFH